MSAGEYDFTERFQEKVLAILWLDSESYAIYQTCIKPKYFTKSIHVDMCRIITEYYEKYEISPTYDVMLEEVNTMIQKNKNKAKFEKEYISTIKNMSSMNLDDLDYIKDRIVGFGKKQAMVDAIIESANILEKNGDYGQVEKLIKDAQLVGEDIKTVGNVYWEDIENRIHSYQYGEDVIERIPTGLNLLDPAMKGGLGRSEMGVVLAPPGRGKTTWLIDRGAVALLNGYNVVHYSFENNEKQILRNYDVRIIGKDIEYLKENPEKSVTALFNIRKYKAGQGQLVIKKYPTKSVTINSLKANLKQLRTMMGFMPDVVIIDYGSLLRPAKSFNEKRDAIESTYEDIRALADEEDVAVWTAAQGNRQSLSKKIVTMEDLAECFAIANVSDFMIALCQTIKEQKKSVMRYFVAKNRDNEDHQTYIGKDLRNIRMFTIDNTVRVEEDEEEVDMEEETKNWGSPKGKKL